MAMVISRSPKTRFAPFGSQLREQRLDRLAISPSLF